VGGHWDTFELQDGRAMTVRLVRREARASSFFVEHIGKYVF
jgi:hypothetical protein